LLHWDYSAQRHIPAFVIVLPEPIRGEGPNLIEIVPQALR
jgi:hypothetical protein